MGTLTLKTPVWKKAVIILLELAFAAFGIVLGYAGYDAQNWLFAIVGILVAGLCLIGAIYELGSRTVLIADAAGVRGRSTAFGRLRAARWDAISGFENATQGTGSFSPRLKMLVIRLKHPELESGSAVLGVAADALHVSNTMSTPFVAGDIYVPFMRLPAHADSLAETLEGYRKHYSAA